MSGSIWVNRKTGQLAQLETIAHPVPSEGRLQSYHSVIVYNFVPIMPLGWMILRRGALTLEFFPYPDLDPHASSFGTCLRLDDLDAFYVVCKAAGLPETSKGHPRLHPPKVEGWGGRIGALIDLDGSLLRLIQNWPDPS